MRWSLYLSVCLVIFQAPMLAQAPDWASVIEPAAKQVMRLEMLREGAQEPGICTAVVINEDTSVALTAGHCVSKPQTQSLSVTANGRHAEVLRVNELLDLALVKVQLRGEKHMLLADKTPRAGTPVAIVGFAYGDSEVMFQFGHIAQTRNSVTRLALLNADVIGGDSGGACVDGQGRLVAINSRIYPWYSSGVAGSAPVEQIKEFAEQFLPKVK